MKGGFSIFVAALLTLGVSWCAFVATPAIQLGHEKQTTVLNSTDIYPVQRSGDAALGLQVYRANGCAQCHTEQIQQSGMACDVVVTGFGKNAAAARKALENMSSANANLTTNDLPKVILHDVTKDVADAASDKITAAGAKAEIHVYATGTDIERGWGLRRSVADDFLWDYPVQLGSNRVGPDLANVGARNPDERWQLLHLYAPQTLVKGSVMPPFRYLFETKKKTAGTPASPDALQLPKGIVPDDVEVIPTEDAKNLVAYLLSLHADVPLYDAPFTPAVAPAEKKNP